MTWGQSTYGGDSTKVSTELQSDIRYIFDSYSAFATLKENRSVITWGGRKGLEETVKE